MFNCHYPHGQVFNEDSYATSIVLFSSPEIYEVVVASNSRPLCRQGMDENGLYKHIKGILEERHVRWGRAV